jgi:hypothetical protein
MAARGYNIERGPFLIDSFVTDRNGQKKTASWFGTAPVRESGVLKNDVSVVVGVPVLLG